MGWTVEFLGEKFSEDDLTLGQLGALEECTKVRHGFFSQILGAEIPIQAEADGMRKLLAALLADRLGCTIDDAQGKVDALRKADITVSDVDDLPKEYEEGFPPSADEASTPT